MCSNICSQKAVVFTGREQGAVTLSVVPEATFRKISDSRQNKFLIGVGDHPDVVKVFNKANNIFTGILHCLWTSVNGSRHRQDRLFT